MRYQKTHSDDIPELTRLWKQAFGDSDEDIARFFRDLFPAATGFAARDGEKIAAMCFALPQQLSCGDTVLSAAYLYAVATDEGYRGQGLCRALLAFAEKELKKRGADAVLLVPADEGLAAMYERLGYRGPARIWKPSEAKEALGTAESVRPVEYAGLRETLLWDVPHVRYGKQLLEYEAGEAQLYALRLGAMPGCAAGHGSEPERVKLRLSGLIFEQLLSVADVRHVPEKRLTQTGVFDRADAFRRAEGFLCLRRLPNARGAAVAEPFIHRGKPFVCRNEQYGVRATLFQLLFCKGQQRAAQTLSAIAFIGRYGVEIRCRKHRIPTAQLLRKGKAHRGDLFTVACGKARRRREQVAEKAGDVLVRVSERLLPEPRQLRDIVRMRFLIAHQSSSVRSALNFSSRTVGW